MHRFAVPLALLIISACASPAPVVVEPEPEPVPSGPAYGSIVVRDGALLVADTPTPYSGDLAAVFPGGADGGVLFALQSADSTTLYHATPGDVERVYATGGQATFTAVWSPDGTQAAFGHYLPRGEASPGRPNMGPGDILVMGAEGVTRVGCSASRAVLAWDPEGRLLVRNTDNLYLVQRDGCATISTTDARRMHSPSVSPDARLVAFIHRELEFDRSTRSYVADSTFRLTDLDGGNPRTIVSFRYRPERLSWRPDGTELVFDVVREESGGGRAISIFDALAGTASFLHPPSEGRPGEFAGSYAPGGERIAYLRDEGEGATSVWVRNFEIPFPSAVPDATEILFWIDRQTLVARRADGVAIAFDASSEDVAELGAADGVVNVWRMH